MLCYRTSAGGWNKSHGQQERTPRLDAFEIGCNSTGEIYIGNTLTKSTYLDYSVYYYGDSEGVEFWYNGTPLKEILTITRLQNGFGTSGQTFWICPFCGKRRRYIYIKDEHFRCRSCARLNYKRQQDNVDSMFWYRLGMEYAREHFEPPPWPIDGFAFCDWIPDRPRYMHQSTYKRYLRRFMRYREKHSDRQIEDLKRILKIYGKVVEL